MKHVIIGSGAAGIAAAKTLRNINKTDEIILISSDDLIYSRCMLHQYLGNERVITNLSSIPNDFFSKNNITWHKGENVTGIDTKKQQLTLQDKTISYDKLLIATGSETDIPDVGDLRTATNVHGFMHLSDAKLLQEKTSKTEKIIIIGTSLVGLDAAYALLKLNKKVTVIGRAPQILLRILDSTAASTYQKLFEQNGCTFRLNSKITNTINNEKNEITHIILETGEKIECDLIIAATGTKPSIKFLENTDIQYERGIKVDQYLKTSCENIYAAGNATALSSIWSCAVKQGETAAKNMHNTNTPYTDTFNAKTSINFFNIPTISMGNINPEDNDTIHTKKHKNSYQKFILKNNTLKGVILQGDIAYSGIWQQLIKNKINLTNIKKHIWDISYADFYNTDKKGQYTYKHPNITQ